ncbi:MAG: hypothetical protein AABX73_00130 [Nanoarchaeota archaeon]
MDLKAILSKVKSQKNKILGGVLTVAALSGAYALISNIPAQKRTYLSSSTNALSVRGEEQTATLPSYSIEEIVIDSGENKKAYMALPLPQNKTAKVGDLILSREVLQTFHLVPYENSRETIRNNSVTTEPLGEVYLPINVIAEEGVITMNTTNTPKRTTITYSLEKTLNEEIKETELGTRTRTLTSTGKKLPAKLIINQLELYRFPIPDSILANDLNLGLMNSNAVQETLIERKDGKTTIKNRLTGEAYALIKADLVDVPEQKPAVEENKEITAEFESTSSQ